MCANYEIDSEQERDIEEDRRLAAYLKTSEVYGIEETEYTGLEGLNYGD